MHGNTASFAHRARTPIAMLVTVSTLAIVTVLPDWLLHSLLAACAGIITLFCLDETA